jgi:hypothetical protein
VDTFVDVNALFARLSTRDDQIIFGRRGTGKTHALSYLAETLRARGETVVYVDLRMLGSTGGIYADAGISVEEAGTRLLIDALQQIYDELLEQTLGGSASADAAGDLALTRLERLGEAISEVSVVGETEHRLKTGIEEATEGGINAAAEISAAGPRLSAFARQQEGRRLAAEREVLLRGVARHRVHFGSVGNALRRLVPSLAGKRLWVLLDEWSHVPMHLQPLLADLLRHCVLPVPGVTVKIAAIDQRSAFKLDREDGSYVGVELGADVAADIDLDEFMVFSNDRESAVEFFAQLFHRHVRAMADLGAEIPHFETAADFVAGTFVSGAAFRELVRAAEGVPRDGINVVGRAALHADSERISLQHVRDAARGWYMLDKESGLRAKPAERELLHWIIDRVIGHRQARAFLIPQGAESHLIDWLYDARLLHLVKRGIAAKDRAGLRFDAYAVDYGCYVDLLATRGAAPRGLFKTEADEFIEVPPDDLEVIRGAILNLETFVPSGSAGGAPEGFPDISVKGHARDGHSFVESVPNVPLVVDSPGWYLLVESSRGILAVPVRKRAVRIGSSSNDHIRIRHESVVPRHAVAEATDDALIIISDRSKALFVNDSKVEVSRLADRDHITVGRVDLLVVHVTAEDLVRTATASGMTERGSRP